MAWARLVVEYCGGGELFDKVIDIGGVTERTACKLMQQICSPLAYMCLVEWLSFFKEPCEA